MVQDVVRHGVAPPGGQAQARATPQAQQFIKQEQPGAAQQAVRQVEHAQHRRRLLRM